VGQGGWAKDDDPIYKRDWTIAPNMSGRRYKKEFTDSNQENMGDTDKVPQRTEEGKSRKGK